MACVHGKETAFGRIHDYRVCRVFEQSGRTRCQLNGDPSCHCFIDDGKFVEDAPHSVEDLRYLEIRDRVQKALVSGRARRFASALGSFFDCAFDQMPDGGAAYYESRNQLLQEQDFTARLAEAAFTEIMRHN